jgi:hypothetical protein
MTRPVAFLLGLALGVALGVARRPWVAAAPGG